jgi:hypothetical protein
MSAPVLGDSVFLGSMLSVLEFWGVIGDGQAPPMINGSFELSGTDGGVALDAIEGPQGPPGAPADIVKMQFQNNFTSPADLPENLENVDIDIGKAWWIGNVVYVWSGTNFFQKQMGVPGPPGPTPQIVCQADLIPSGEPTSLTLPIEVKQFGTPLNPSLLFQFDQDSITGPAGPTGPIRGATDYDNTVAPDNGAAILWNAALQLWAPGTFDLLSLPVYSIPEQGFTSVIKLAGGVQEVATFAVPPQPFDWMPLVLGNIAAVGGNQGGILGDIVQFFEDLFGFAGTNKAANAGATVTLGDPITGQVVGRGFGNTSNYAFILPHFSTPSTPSVSVSPTSSTAVVPAYHTGSQGTLFVTVHNEQGLFNGFHFESQNAQLVIVCIPTSDFIPPQGPGKILSGKGRLSALAVSV